MNFNHEVRSLPGTTATTFIFLFEVHSETDTCGSVLLAGVLLKVGSYGLMRFTLTLFPVGYSY